MTKYSTRKIKMIGIDLDGTLLTPDKRLTEHTREILTQALERGVTVLPATGRPLTGIPGEVLELPGVRYAVSSNGARIVDLKENKVIYENPVPYEKAMKILEICSGYDALCEIFYKGVGYADADKLKCLGRYIPREPMAHYIESTRKAVDNVKALLEQKKASVDKVQAIFRTLEDCREARQQIGKQVQDIEITGALSNNIEVNAKGVNKGRGLLILAEILGIRREEIMAFGDGSNDIEMIRTAGLGVAMANAIDAVKDAADAVTLSNEEDGVAAAVEKYVLSEA